MYREEIPKQVIDLNTPEATPAPEKEQKAAPAIVNLCGAQK